MPVWYCPATPEDHELLSSVIDEFYPDLAETKANIGLVLAYPDVKTGKPPLMRNKLRILAKIKPNSEADRVDGKPDATITLDASHWRDIQADGDDAQARALIDHELYHLEVRRERKSGRIKTDKAGRPMFNTRPHDWEITGFAAVARRHKLAAAEVIEARIFYDRFGNLLFHFGAEHAVQRDIAFVADRPGPTRVVEVVAEVVGQINAGAMGPNVTAEVVPARRHNHPAPAAVAAANR